MAILELRKQVEVLRQQSERLGREAQAGADDSAQLRRALVDMQSQIDALRGELSQAKGDRDLLVRELAETQRKLKDQAQGVEDRLRKFEPVKVKIDGVEVEVEPAEAKDYDQALATFRKGDFAAASAPILPPAPGRLSTTICVPSASPSRGEMMRATRSALPPTP